MSRAWAEARRHVGAYTGGEVQLLQDGSVLAANAERVSRLSLDSGVVLGSVQGALPEASQEPILAFAVSPADPNIVSTAARSLLIRTWSLSDGSIQRTWRGPTQPVSCMVYDRTGALLATGCASGAVMVWNATEKFCTHNFVGHGRLIKTLAFHPTRLQLVSCCEDTDIRVWDLHKSACVAVLDAHHSVPTAVAFNADGSAMVSGGRDKMLFVWDMGTFKATSETPVFEAVEAVVTLPPSAAAVPTAAGSAAAAPPSAPAASPSFASSFEFMSAGDKGLLRHWRVSVTGTIDKMFVLQPVRYVSMTALLGPGRAAPSVGVADTDVDAKVSHQVSRLLLRSSRGELVAVTQDHNLVVVDIASLSRLKTLTGFNDEIIDIKYIPGGVAGRRTAAVATNSDQLRLVDVESFSTRLLDGHSAVVLFVDPSPDGRFVATASKDRTARVWDVETGECLAVCEGHTHAVGCVVWPRRVSTFGGPAASWLITGSKDLTLKMWDASTIVGSKASKKHRAKSRVASDVAASSEYGDAKLLGSVVAVRAHDKDVNYLAVSPNDALVASASQDKTIKLWRTTGGGLDGVATLRGHKRGVWAVRFSPAEKCLASASGDRTIRLWSVTDYTCLSTLQGHTASVLCLQFIRNGTQLLSGSADGMVNLWTIKESECVATFDAHTDKVWALAVSHGDGSSGGADGQTSAVAGAGAGASAGAGAGASAGAGAGAGAAAPSADVELEMMTGGADSTLIVWKDTTEEMEAAARAVDEEQLLAQQELFNKMAARDYQGAVELCIKLNQPKRLQAILQELVDVGPTKAGGVEWKDDMIAEMEELRDEDAGRTWTQARGSSVDADAADDAAYPSVVTVPCRADAKRTAGQALLRQVLTRFSSDNLDRLLLYLRDWNTQSRHALFAQQVLAATMRTVPASKLRACPSFRDVVAALTPYTIRHLERMDRMLESTYLLDYTLASMHQLMPEEAAAASAEPTTPPPAAKPTSTTRKDAAPKSKKTPKSAKPTKKRPSMAKAAVSATAPRPARRQRRASKAT